MKRHAILAALALLFAGAAQAAVTEFILYKQPNFKGDSQTVKGEVNILENGFDHQARSLIVRGGYWEVCTEDRFHGTCRALGEGQYPTLTSDIDGKIVSVRFLGNDPKVAQRAEREKQAALERDRLAARERDRYAYRDERDYRREGRSDRGYNRRGALELYGGESFNGRSIRIEDNVNDLYDRRFDGRASSLIVEQGTWQLCTEPGFEGRCRTFEPGEYPRLAALDNRVNSVRQVR